ncbi:MULTISPECIES: ATP-binding cassette domain-containing protein [unclassified Frankia]|uniref:ATP-binding cassette domain-containing protein n=2 Tax=Frankia TaxID=1854 RepID=UPI002AD594CB|nr:MULTISPECIES: ATP-binding cassette domain-containing protein [unclassified Frankia]
MTTPMIEVRAVTKRFGSIDALAGVDLSADAGTVLGLLGPNGAGKTTLVRILATLLRPDSGLATIAGYDVVRHAQRLRSMIGLAGQYAAVDEMLTGRENLELVGLLYHVGKAERRRRAQEVLERFSLTEAADRQVKTYSGGMRRRLDLGASLVGHPSVLILDEPTTGLDPRTRNELWTLIEDLVTDGTTVVLTTQYLEEAERLAHRIVVIDRGRVVAAGTADELKSRAGGAMLEARVVDPADLGRVAALLADLGDGPPQLDAERRRVAVPTGGGAKVLLAAGRRLDDDGVALDDLGIRRPSLDDVFLSLTGHAAGEPADDGSGARSATGTAGTAGGPETAGAAGTAPIPAISGTPRRSA